MVATGDRLRIGIIGCGEIVQVAHIATLGFLSDYFAITYLSDVSESALKHCRQKVVGVVPQISRNASELCASPDVDVVLVASPDEYHAEHTIAALQNDKYVLVEKPMALNRRDADSIIQAESKSKGKVMVGYMRRYAEAFEEAVRIVGGMDQIHYARVRDIIGPNSVFVSQSGTFPKHFTDFTAEDTAGKAARATEMVAQGLAECGVKVTDETTRMWRLLGSLGSHDISAMRELLGMPTGVLGASLGTFWSAIFTYPSFSCTYESGWDNIPRFDAHIEVYSPPKSVRIRYDTPFVKGLPITLEIRENVDGVYRESSVRKTYEDPYTIEFKRFYDFAKHGKNIKTTSEDAREDLVVFGMIMSAGRIGP